MPNELFSERNLIISGIVPVADAFAGTVYSDIYDVSEAHQLTFIRYQGAEATGTSTLTVEACSTITATATTAVTFRYRRVADTTASDVPGAVTAATTAGFTTTAGGNQIYIIEVDASVIAATGYKYARLKSVESANDPVTGCLFAILSDLRLAQATPASMID